VRVREETEYPFRDHVRIHIDPEHPVHFPLKLRVPSWARSSTVRINGRTTTIVPQKGFIVVERNWHQGDQIELQFAFETQTVRGFNQSVSVERGPLLFSLPIATRWSKLRDRGLRSADWEVFPASAWNYAIAANSQFEHHERPLGSVPFNAASASVTITVNARQLTEWDTQLSYAPPPPMSPVIASAETGCTVTLVPYGAAKLRITSFPVFEA